MEPIRAVIEVFMTRGRQPRETDRRQEGESAGGQLRETLKGAMGLIVDALDARHKRAIDLTDRGESAAAEPEAKVNQCY
jgi:hypothetical protein